MLSIAIGGVAIFVALRAAKDAKEAEARSRRFLVQEPKRVLVLEVLRELAAAVDDGSALSRDFSSRLAILPDTDLPDWRRYRELRDQNSDLGVLCPAFLGPSAKPTPPDLQTQTRSVLGRDVLRAIERRVQSLEQLAEGNAATTSAQATG